MEGLKRKNSSRNGELSYILALPARDAPTMDAQRRTRIRGASHGADDSTLGAQRMAPIRDASQGADGSTLGAQRMSPIREASYGADGSILDARILAPIGVLHGTGYFMDIIMINAGEDIREKILSYFQDREKFPSYFEGHSCFATILSATGCVSSPTLRCQGSAVPYKESFALISMKGCYSVDRNGHSKEFGDVSIEIADSNANVFGGAVIGSLIAGIPIQVIVGSFINDC